MFRCAIPMWLVTGVAISLGSSLVCTRCVLLLLPLLVVLLLLITQELARAAAAVVEEEGNGVFIPVCGPFIGVEGTGCWVCILCVLCIPLVSISADGTETEGAVEVVGVRMLGTVRSINEWLSVECVSSSCISASEMLNCERRVRYCWSRRIDFKVLYNTNMYSKK